MSKSILDSVHEAAQDLNNSGLMNDTTMRDFDALCLPPIKEYTPKQIQGIRKRNKVSQPIFAAYLNTSASTIRQWEQGDKNPRGISLKILNLVDKNGLVALM